MANSAYNMITGAAGAGRTARRMADPRAFGEGKGLPTLHKLRS